MDFYHDLEHATNDPKIKGFFLCLLVKPDLNFGEVESFAGEKSNAGSADIFNSLGNADTRKNQKTKDFHNIKTGDAGRAWSLNNEVRRTFRGSLTRSIIDNLSHTSTNYFSNIISNAIESVSYPDVGSNSEDTLVTLDKAIYKLPVTETGHSGLTFSLRLRENEGHDALRMMSVWHKYIQAVTKGRLVPKEEYLKYNIIDYKASLYTIHLKPDFKTITMWSKYTGIYPSSLPISALSESIEDVSDVALDFEFTYDKFEWMDEDILREINLLTSNSVINRVNSQQSSAYTYMRGNQNRLISRIKGTPFYQIDINGLEAFFRNRIDPKMLPASMFGARIDSEIDAYFPAPLNEQMVNVSTDRFHTIKNNPAKSKIVEKKYDYKD